MAQSDDDFAPGGSEVTRKTHGSRAEQLPPGRRNQTASPPSPRRAPSRQRRTTDPKSRGEQAEQPSPEAVDEAVRRVRSGRMVPIEPSPDADEQFGGGDAGLPAGITERIEPFMPTTAVGAEPSTEENTELLQMALMYALRLRVIGEGDAGTWDDFDRLALNALAASASDPFDDATPAQRFLYGFSGWAQMPDDPEEIGDLEDIADVVNLGQPTE